MKLFRTDNETQKTAQVAMEKTADIKISDNSENWADEIQEQVSKQLPSTSGRRIFVDLKERDDHRGYAQGEIVIDGKFTIPFFIREFKLTPLDILIYKGKTFAATRKKILEILHTNKFGDRLSDKKDQKLISMQTATMSPLSQAIGLLDTDYFVSGKLASDFDYFIESGKSGFGYDIYYRDRYTGEKEKTFIPKFASGNFFKSIGKDPIESAEKIASEGFMCVAFTPQVARVEENSFKEIASGLLSKTASVRVFDNYGREHQGIYFKKIATPSSGDIEDSSLFVGEKGFSRERKICGNILPYDFDLSKISKEPEKGDSGFLVFNMGTTKLAFGPLKILSDKSRVENQMNYKVADEKMGKMTLRLDPRKSRPVFLEKLSMAIFPEKVAFVKMNNEIKLSNDPSYFEKEMSKKNSISIRNDGVEFSYKIATERFHEEGRFDNRQNLANALQAKGIEPGAISQILNTEDLAKRNILAKIVWKEQEDTMSNNVQKEAPVPNGLVPGGGSAGKSMPRELSKFSSDLLIEDINNNSHCSQICSRSMFGPVSLKDSDVEKISSEIQFLRKKVAFDLRKLAGSSLEKTVVDVLMLDDSNMDMEKFYDTIPDMLDLENKMSQLLLEVRAGRKKVPESTLSNLVRSLGIIRDSLEILKETGS